MRLAAKQCLAALLFMISTDCGEVGHVKFKGRYIGDFDVGGGTYRTIFMFTDNNFTKEFFFVDEEELVWRCTGTYTVDDNRLLRARRVCEFLRSEEPTPAEGMPNIVNTINDLTDTSFVLCFEKDDNSVPDTTVCVKFVIDAESKAKQ